MIHRIIYPSEILKSYIKSYHVIETNDSAKFLDKHRVYTYGCIVLVFHYGKPSLFQKKNESAYIEPMTVICGQQTSYYDLALSGKTGMIFIIFQPYGAGVFFSIPMYELANQNLSLDYLINKKALEIESKILNARSTPDRIKHIENFLLARLIQYNKNAGQIISTFNSINHNRGRISIDQLAKISCLSIKQFERKFSALVGLNPKQYLRIVRFQNIIYMKTCNRFSNYTTLAYDCGYYDQSHFIHDFKRITDLSPKEFFKGQTVDP